VAGNAIEAKEVLRKSKDAHREAMGVITP